jgi:hypothetical protein
MRYTQTPTPSITATPSLTPSNTPSYTPSNTACTGLTPTATSSQTPTPTPTKTFAVTPTITPTKTATPTPTPTNACVCDTYTVQSISTTESTRVDWIDCSGNPQTNTLLPLNGISFCACNGSVTTVGGDVTVDELDPCIVYTWFGTTSTYSGGTSACTNRNCSRPYYTALPVVSVGQVIYDDTLLTIPFNGGSRWIAVNPDCTGSWFVIQVDATGNVINTYTPCP